MAVRSMLREDLNAMTPRLRRYARALATGGPGPSELADDIVHATLMRALGSRSFSASADRTVRVFATVTQLHRDVAASGRQALVAVAGRPALPTTRLDFAPAVRPGRIATALLSLPLEHREAILLVALEGFGHGEAARILRIPRATLFTRLTQARSALDDTLASWPQPAQRAPAGRGRRAPHLKLVT